MSEKATKTKSPKAPIVAHIWLGSGESGLALKQKIFKLAMDRGHSVAELFLNSLKKTEPSLFKGA